jgi:type II secretory pathway pseudopilin PulG
MFDKNQRDKLNVKLRKRENKVKPIAKQPNKKAAFTIVELLTVMSIIIILMGLLAPAMNRVRIYARKVSQVNQFHSIDVALEMFRAEFDGYPDSGALDRSTPAGGVPYCGAMKLAEAMVGQDLLGFHPDSRFRSDGTDGVPPPAGPTTLYYYPGPPPPDNLKARKEYYLSLENANAYKLKDIYTNPAPFDPERFVLCDVYTRAASISTGKRIGMPILYYKANTSNIKHDPADLPVPGNDKGQIYNYLDNNQLVELGKPWNPPPTGPDHMLFSDPKKFYTSTWNEKISTITRPYRADSYIMLSAGFDGEYGTPDDVFNFGED